jgi:thiol-disulfide isomerase/thioredoxin
MRTYLSFEIRIRRALGVAVILGAVAIALDRGTHERAAILTASAAESQPARAEERPMPDLGGAPTDQRIPTSNDKERFMPESIAWLNSAGLSNESLRGKVVLVDFWTYSCINSLRNLPYVKAWAAKYKDAGLVVIGVHTPEFAFEKVRANVARATRDLKVTYPVPIDSNYRIWQAFNNEYWPADYFIDGKRKIRYHHFGEGNYAESERVIQDLLKDNGATGVSGSTVRISADGVGAPPSNEVGSPETYVGYRRAERLASPGRLAQDSRKVYSPPATPSLNQWGLTGPWNVGAESAVLQAAPGKIVFRFHARDLHMVLGPATNGTPVRFKVKLDGTAPSRDFGVDSGPDGTGEVRRPRLYQLIRQKGHIADRTFEIEFLDPGVHAYVFTFG